MLSTKLIIILMIANACVSIVSLCEGNYVRALYWLGAAIINCSISLMK